MSVVVTRSRSDLIVRWVNEIIILCPSHPESMHAGKPLPSHAISVVTMLVMGLRDGDSLANQDAKWQIGIVQRGRIDTKSLYETLDLSNKSLSSTRGTKHIFFNQILSLTRDKREIEAVSGAKPRVGLFLSSLFDPRRVVDARVLAKEDVETNYMENLDCTKISIKGQGSSSQVLRFLYRHEKPVVRPPRPVTYEVDTRPGSKFPLEETFEIYSFHKVLRKLEAGVADNVKAAERFNAEVLECMIPPNEEKFVQDLVVVCDPRAFDYSVMASQLASVETGVQSVDKWVSLNGEPPLEMNVPVYEVFPKPAFRRSPDSFSMRFSARLSCIPCRKYIISKEQRALHASFMKEMEALEKRFAAKVEEMRSQKHEGSAP